METKSKSFRDATPAERIERWENVERVLLGLDAHAREKHWNMEYWGIDTDCGTVACAAGHCALDQWFIDRGFSSKPTHRMDITDYGNVAVREFMGGQSVSSFFGYIGTNSIFWNNIKRPVDDVIQEVRAYIETLKEAA